MLWIKPTCKCCGKKMKFKAEVCPVCAALRGIERKVPGILAKVMEYLKDERTTRKAI